jgi:hypothetical protein
MHYSYSLRIWLTGRKSKAAAVLDEKGFKIGSEVKAKLEKSRFGTEGRNCTFRILWGTREIGIQDEESWFDAVKGSKQMVSAGSWYTMTVGDYSKKFQPSKWTELIKTDDEFKAKVLELMETEVIQKFDSRQGNAADYYDNE